MPRLTLTLDDKAAGLPDAVVPLLQRLTDRTNAQQKTTFSVLDWLALHLKELAIADDLAAAVEQLRQQQQTDAEASLAAAVNTARDELLASLAAT